MLRNMSTDFTAENAERAGKRLSKALLSVLSGLGGESVFANSPKRP
jgi:hypothetical protein